MKVLPKQYMPTHLFNEEDFEEIHFGYILPETERFYDELYDERVATETYVENLKKMPFEKWTKAQKSAYAQYLLDSHSESLT